MDCKKCTMCCEILPIEEINKDVNIICVNCEQGVGCKNYSQRPESCKKFECAYRQVEKAHEDLRPDNCKVIFERVEDIMHGSIHKDFLEAINSKPIKAQVNFFLNEGFSVILRVLNKNNPLIIPNKNETKESVIKKFKEYIENGSS